MIETVEQLDEKLSDATNYFSFAVQNHLKHVTKESLDERDLDAVADQVFKALDEFRICIVEYLNSVR